MDIGYLIQGFLQFIDPYFWPFIVVCAVLAFIFLRSKTAEPDRHVPQCEQVELEPMKKRDFTLEELREYDGVKNDRILIAVNFRVFDVTPAGDFYGKNGTYHKLAGHDASRSLATFSLEKDVLREQFDDLEDFNEMQMESLREWEIQFKEKYYQVGRLLRPGEEPHLYEGETEMDDAKTLKKD